MTGMMLSMKPSHVEWMGWPMALGLPHCRTCRFTFQWAKIIFGKWTTYRRDDLPVNHGEIDQSKQLNMAINGFDFQGLVRSQQPQLVKSCVAQVLGHGIRTSLAVSTRAAATTDDNSGNDGFHEFLTWCVWLNMNPQDSAFKWVNWWSTIWFWYICGMAWEMLPSLFGTSNLVHPPQNLWDSHHVEVAMHPWYSVRFLCFFHVFLIFQCPVGPGIAFPEPLPAFLSFRPPWRLATLCRRIEMPGVQTLETCFYGYIITDLNGIIMDYHSIICHKLGIGILEL